MTFLLENAFAWSRVCV